MRSITRTALVLTLVVSVGLLAACGGSKPAPTAAQPSAQPTSSVALTGAGATFPYPLYSKWFSDYAKTTGVKINYQSIGSGGGIKQITEKTVDFGASDAPMKDEQLAAAPGLLHIPTVLGAVVLVYNLEGVKDLKLTPDVVAGLFLGKITRWNDAAIAAVNPGVKLPAVDVAVAHRSDGSGTTNVFVDYLSKISPEWKEKVGVGTSVKWPAGIGGQGNEGVAGVVRQTPGAIGYVEVAYAEQNKLAVAQLQNKAGKFVAPSIEAISAAAAGFLSTMPDDFRLSVTNSSDEKAYPISAFTYILVYKDQADKAKGEALVKFLWWAIHDGQKTAAELSYAPLPQSVVPLVEKKLKTITAGGQVLLP